MSSNISSLTDETSPNTPNGLGRLGGWAECQVRSMEMTLQSGHFDRLERMLGDARTERVLTFGDVGLNARIAALKGELVSAREREKVAGGPGSLIDPAHPLTHGFAATDRSWRLAEARRRHD